MTNVFIVVAPLQIECIPIESKSLGVLRVVRGELYQSGFKRRAIFLPSPDAAWPLSHIGGSGC
jgi:hypothetical protein